MCERWWNFQQIFLKNPHSTRQKFYNYWYLLYIRLGTVWYNVIMCKSSRHSLFELWYGNVHTSESISQLLSPNSRYGYGVKRKSQSIPSVPRFQICFAKAQSRFRSLESRMCDERMRKIEKLSAFLVANFSRGIYCRLAYVLWKTEKFIFPVFVQNSR